MLTYDVRVCETEVRPDHPMPYRVRWSVGRTRHSTSFGSKEQADLRQAELMNALEQGERFDVEMGLPVSEVWLNALDEELPC